MVFGLVVRSMGAAKGITAGFRALAGGEVKQYTKLVEDSRRHALDRMIENARILGANAICACASTRPRWARASPRSWPTAPPWWWGPT